MTTSITTGIATVGGDATQTLTSVAGAPGEFIHVTPAGGDRVREIPGQMQYAVQADGLFITTPEQYNDALRVKYDTGRKAGYESARAGLIELFIEINGDSVEDLNAILEHLGMDLYSSKWSVTVEIEGQHVLTVIVDTETEEDAIAMVDGNLSIGSYSTSVSIEFDGDGETDDSNEYEIDTDYILDGTLSIDISAERVEG